MTSNLRVPNLRRILGQLSGRGVDAIADEAAEIVEREVVRSAPRLSGALATSVIRRRVSNGVVRVIARRPYVLYVEYGTSRQAPRPFMRGSMRRQRRVAIARASRKIQQQLR